METPSRGQQFIVLLIIFGMTLLYYHSINVPDSFHPHPDWDEGGIQPAGASPLTQPGRHDSPHSMGRVVKRERLAGAKLLTLNKPVNINTATKSDIKAIPGIGPKTSEKIIEYRQEHGLFEKVEDIMNVRGIKGKRFESIKRYLTVK